MHSALYSGWVRHRRYEPVRNDFRYAVSMAFLDLDELDTVFQKRLFWSSREFNLAWFRRDDYMLNSRRPEQPLADAVRDFVEDRSGTRPLGPIRILTNLRRFGFGMNPVSFYYCYHEDGVTLQTIVAEITNTPWNEQYSYVLPCETQAKKEHRFLFNKSFHVSPFMDMNFEYDWRFRIPGQRLLVHMLNQKHGGTLFDSTLLLKRREITTRALAADLVGFPLMTLKVFAAIYFHAAKLWIKRCPSFSHPKTLDGEKTAS